jgi:formylglycine-generating enzyme required for sulfatase activity
MLRPKQKPFFSTLDDLDLDISVPEKEEKVPLPEKPEQVFSPKVPLTESVSARIAEPPPEPVFETVPDVLVEPVPEPPVVEQAPVTAVEPVVETVIEAAPIVEAVPPPASVRESIPLQKPEPVAVQPEPVPVVSVPKAIAAATDRPAPKPVSKPENAGFDAVFVTIPPGSFIMGSPEDEPGRNPDESQHEVTITKGFSIQATPVTQRQWQSVMGANPSGNSRGGDDCPVEGVSWNDGQEFIRKLNQKGEYWYRLPTEAEWEYACRAGTITACYAGEVTKKLFSKHDPCLEDIAWYRANAGGKTHPVAEKKPNPWGLFDMLGNVLEWCQDWYGKYPILPQTDPQGVALGAGCVVRGGAWSSPSADCRSARRQFYSPNTRNRFVGLRLVRGPWSRIR